MITFPDWVCNPKRQSKAQLASKRLRYLVLNAAVKRTVNGNIVSFGVMIGLQRGAVHSYIKAGAFSQASALRAEQIFGQDLIRAEWLTDPLSIVAG